MLDLEVFLAQWERLETLAEKALIPDNARLGFRVLEPPGSQGETEPVAVLFLDLGNVEANAQGVAKVDVKAKGVDLHHILGRSIVVHADPDDLKSQPAGNAGPRIGVGVIGLAETKAATAAK